MQEEAQFYLNIARFHPLIVHLPIGILFFALILEVLKRWKKRTDLDFSIRTALFFGTASAVLAAITGWFLSEEGGYESDALFWHKWMGISLAVASLTALLFHIAKAEKLRRFSFTMMLLVAALLMITGHLGGNMTHGEDYLFSKPPEEVTISGDIDQVKVYQELVAPILTNKCNSCHNESKTKGDLIMTTQAGLFVGGKSGSIFDFVEIPNSEILKRIHLPKAAEDHMPPEGKLQLTENEIALLSWWVKNQACVDCLVGETTGKEEMQAVLDEYLNKEPEYDVDPLSKRQLAELRAENISVSAVAEDHPMVLVNLSYRKDLGKKTFKLLRSIAENVLELNLAGASVDDVLAKNLSSFTNLRKLQLQNTSITDEALKHISELEYLESLNVYQTEVSDQAINFLLDMPALKQVYLWKTKVSAEAINEMQAERPELAIQHEISDEIFGKNVLGPPVFSAENPIFKGATVVTLSSFLSGVAIYYTLDGSQPDTLSSRYTEPLKIEESMVVKAVNYKQGWTISEPAETQLMEIKTIPINISLEGPPSEKYKANGPLSLIDGKKGTSRFTEGLWIGYEGEDLTATLELSGEEEITEVTVSALSEQGSWILYPKSIEVLSSADGKTFRPAGELQIPLEEAAVLISGMQYFKVPALIGTSKFVRVIVKSHLSNPDWHPNPGGKCWIFIDEILLN